MERVIDHRVRPSGHVLGFKESFCLRFSPPLGGRKIQARKKYFPGKPPPRKNEGLRAIYHSWEDSRFASLFKFFAINNPSAFRTSPSLCFSISIKLHFLLRQKTRLFPSPSFKIPTPFFVCAACMYAYSSCRHFSDYFSARSQARENRPVIIPVAKMTLTRTNIRKD